MRAGWMAFVVALAASPTIADDWKDESGKGREQKHEYKHEYKHEGRAWKEEYDDGHCKVERKLEKNGEYKEERKCRGQGQPVHVVPAPVYRPGPGVYLGGMPTAIGPMQGIPGIACNRDVIGGLIGGAAGGLIGNQVGKGSGNTAATIGGVVVGAIVGGTVGRQMDQADHACVAQALEYGQSNQAVAWRDPDGRSYQVTPTRTYQQQGHHCREYVTRASVDGRNQRITGTACRDPNGTWRIVR
jgi:surface antigen